MKLLFGLASIVICLSSPLTAAPCDWDKTDAIMLSTIVIFRYMDYKQTLEIAEEDQELNPILGPSPSKTKTQQFFISTTIGFLVISCSLSKKDRKVLHTTFLTLQGSAVYWNYSLDFRF